MIHLFKPTTTKNELIENNGDFILDHITKSAKITEELNGNYTLDLSLIIDKSFDSKCYDLISESSIIKIDDENGYEYFRIASVIKNKNYIDVFARHITISDILTMWLEDVRPENKNGNDALNWIFNNSTTKNNFTVRSDISTYNTAYYLNKNVYEALFTVDNSFLNRWGGEVKRTGFTIEINKTIGKNNGVSIRSRKNLIGFEASTNVNELTTRIYPKGFDGITINEKYIDSEYINSYPQVFSREVVFDDVRVNDESYNEGFETLEEAQAELKRRSKLLFTEDKNDIIKATYKVDFVQLEKTEEYKNFAVIETTNLGDIVNVYDETLNVDIDVRVISRVYDCIKKERTSTTLSNKNVITKPTSITSIIQQLEKVPSSESILNDAKKVASTLLKQGNKDSYVVVRENEVLIMDTKDVNTAKKVWRFNNNGLGFSNTGYFGTYGLAMTMDGSIVADFITTGVLNGALIKAKSIEAESLNVSLKEKIESSLGNKEVTTIVESAIKQSKEEIELSISNTYETKTNVSSQINGTLSSAKSYADTKKTEAINEANSTLNSTITNYYTKTQTDSAIKVAKDSINLGVSQTYETKANVTSQVTSTLNSAKSYADTKKSEAISTASSDATNKVNTAKNELNTAINKKANSVDVYTKTEVYTKAQTDSAIKVTKDNIELGVKNTYETKTEVNSKINAIQIGGTNLLKKKSGFTYGYLSSSNGSITNTGSLNTNQDFYTNDYIFVKQGTPITFTSYPKQGVTSNIQSAVYIHFYNTNKVWQWCKSNVTSANQNSSVTYTTVDDCYVRFCARGFNDYNHKAEYGTKATDWSPCPSDVDGSISSAITESKNYADSQIKIAKDSINLGVSNTYETKTNVTSKVNNAISTASSDATTKANNALSSAKSYADTKKTEAINSANNTLNTTIANYYTKSQTDSQIDVAKNAITQSVSNTYETKTNVQNKIDAIKVGGTNLLGGTGTAKTRNVNNPTSYDVFDTYFTDGNKTTLRALGFKVNDELSVSFDWKISQNGSLAMVYGNFRAEFMGFNSSNTDGQYLGVIKNPVANFSSSNTSGRLETTIKLTEAMLGAHCLRIRTDNSVLTLTISNCKWEKGNKVTSWSPSPKDMETTVSNLTQRVSTAESKITDTAITNVVRQNFYTKTETNNQITSKGYQTSSQVQQTVDALQLKFTQSGGYNRIRNGIFKNGTSQWSSWGSPTISTKTDTGHSYGKSLVLTTTANNQGVQQIVSDLCSGKTYTLSAYVYTWAANDCGIQIACGGSYYSAKVPSSGSWQRISVTFKATATTATVQIGRGGWGANGQHLFTAIQFEEGELATTYTPHPSEIYDGITTIDKDGITVTGSNSAYTNFNSTGMNSFNNSGQQTLGIRNGGITFHPYSNNQLGAYITQSALWNGSASANGLAISTANNGTYISLGTSSLSDANTTLNMDQALTISASDNFQPKGINFWKNVHAHGYGIRQLDHLHLAGSGAIQFDYLNNSPSTIYEATSSGHSLYVMGGYQMHLGCMAGTGTPKGMIWFKGQTDTHSYTHWDFHNYTMYNMKTATSYANTLTRKTTETYGVTSNVEGVRYLYRDVKLVDGKAIRSIPNEFMGCGYDITSIVCKGRGQAWVESEGDDRFEIQGDCLSVNVEIIIYPVEDVMMMSTVEPTEAPALGLPEEVIGEVAPLITNKGCVLYDF